jgi:uncharacterized cupin superfamily protein
VTSPASIPINAFDIPPRERSSFYPEIFAARVAGRRKRQLGNHFGLSRFGVNLTTLSPGSQSALLHRHSHQDEFIYIVSGTPTLRTDVGEHELSPGMCVGFPAKGRAHHLINRSNEEVCYLEIGDRNPDDCAEYPQDDLALISRDGIWHYAHKDGSLW